MKRELKKQSESKQYATPLPYHTPSLISYGSLKKLTKTGSQSGTENTGHPEKNNKP